MLSLNILACNRPGFVAYILAKCLPYFDKVRILDQSDYGDDRISDIVSRYMHGDNFTQRIYYQKFVWEGSLSKSLTELIRVASFGEWFFYIADDEMPSEHLLVNLYNIIEKAELEGCNKVQVPFMVSYDLFTVEDIKNYIHEARCYAVGEYMKSNDLDPPLKYRIGRIFKVTEHTTVTGTTHEYVQADAMDYLFNTEYPIIHNKSSDGWLISNLWTSVIDPDFQGLSDDKKRNTFRQALEKSNISSSGDEADILYRLRTSDIDPSLISWMKNNHDADNAVELSWYSIYYFKYHPDEILGHTDFIRDRCFQVYFKMCSEGYLRAEKLAFLDIHPSIRQWLMEHQYLTIGQVIDSMEMKEG